MRRPTLEKTVDYFVHSIGLHAGEVPNLFSAIYHRYKNDIEDVGIDDFKPLPFPEFVEEFYKLRIKFRHELDNLGDEHVCALLSKNEVPVTTMRNRKYRFRSMMTPKQLKDNSSRNERLRKLRAKSES